MKVFFPYCNPIQFKNEGVYENYLDAQVFEEAPEFVQHYCKNDRIQFIVNWADVSSPIHNIFIDVIVNGVRINIHTHNITAYGFGGVYYSSYYNQQAQSRTINSGYYVFSQTIDEIKKDNIRLIKNCDDFQFVITVFGVDYYSNALSLIEEKSDTKLLQYGIVSDPRSKPLENIYLDTLFSALFEPFEIRLPATFLQPTYKTNKEVFESYSKNIELISSVPFETIPLEIGKNLGVPDWFIKSLNFIFHCRGKKIDNVEYELTPESTLEIERLEGYNLRLLRVELAPSKNLYSFLNEYNTVRPIYQIVTLERISKLMTGTLQIAGTGDWSIEDQKDGTLISISLTQLKGKDETEVSITAPLNNTNEDIEKHLVFKANGRIIEITVIIPKTKSGIGYGRIGETFYIG